MTCKPYDILLLLEIQSVQLLNDGQLSELWFTSS